MKWKTKVQNYLEYRTFIFFVNILKSIPYIYAQHTVCFLFDLIGYKLGLRRKVATIQLRSVFPDITRKREREILKASYRVMAKNALDEFVLSDDELYKRSTMINKEYIDEAFNISRGVILATAHFGNWEAARVFPRFGIPTSVITKRQRNRLFDDYTNSIRTRMGVNVIDMRKGLRDIISHLSKNELVAILADQNAGKSGLVFDFMGYPASHWVGVAKLSLRYKVPIVCGYAVRNPQDGVDFTFEKMIYFPELEDIPDNYEFILRQIDDSLIRFINLYPEQWFWVHKRWKGAFDLFSSMR